MSMPVLARHVMTSVVGTAVIGAVLALPFVIAGTGHANGGGPGAAWVTLVVVQMAWCFAESMAVAAYRPTHCPCPPAGVSRWLPMTAAGLACVVVGGAAWTTAHEPAGSETFLGWRLAFGVALAIGGGALRIGAIRRLGTCFLDEIALLPGRHRLETEGVFAFMRHPAEGGFLLLLLATAVISGSALILLIWGLAVVPLSWRRLVLEDRLLRERFGAAARRYQEAVPALAR